MENIIFSAVYADSNNSTNSNATNKVTVGVADPNSILYHQVFDRVRIRKEAGYDPNPITLEVYDSGDRSQRDCWTFDRFKILSEPDLWVEGETGPKDWTGHRTPHSTLTFKRSDGTLAARIFYGLKEDRLLTEVYAEGEEKARILKGLGITNSKEYFRGGESHDIFLDAKGTLLMANEALKRSWLGGDDPKESVDAIQSILTILWDRSQSFQWLALHGYIIFGDNTQVMCINPNKYTRYFRWNKDLGKWIHYKTDLNRFLSVEFPEALPEELDEDNPDWVFDISSGCRRAAVTFFNAFKAMKKRKESTLSSREANTLAAEEVANPNSVFLRMVEEGSSHETFAWGCDMEGKILVDEDAKRRVKPEWKDKVVICHKHFRREAPNPWTFPEGFVDICDVLEDDAEVSAKGRTVYTGAGCTFVSLGGMVVALNNPCNSRTTKGVNDREGFQSIYWEVNKLPLIDWERTLAVRPNTTVGDLKVGRFYCWKDGYTQRENDHQTGRRTSVWMVSPDAATAK